MESVNGVRQSYSPLQGADLEEVLVESKEQGLVELKKWVIGLSENREYQIEQIQKRRDRIEECPWISRLERCAEVIDEFYEKYKESLTISEKKEMDDLRNRIAVLREEARVELEKLSNSAVRCMDWCDTACSEFYNRYCCMLGVAVIVGLIILSLSIKNT